MNPNPGLVADGGLAARADIACESLIEGILRLGLGRRRSASLRGRRRAPRSLQGEAIDDDFGTSSSPAFAIFSQVSRAFGVGRPLALRPFT